MSYAYSPDQTNITERFPALPANHWVQDSPTEGHYVSLTVGNAATHGYYPIDGSAVRPADTGSTTWEASWPFILVPEPHFVLTYVERAKTAKELDDDARRAKRTAVGGMVSTLRSWADDANGTTVTSGNAVATLQTVVDRLGVFFDRFADLIEAQRLDQ